MRERLVPVTGTLPNIRARRIISANAVQRMEIRGNRLRLLSEDQWFVYVPYGDHGQYQRQSGPAYQQPPIHLHGLARGAEGTLALTQHLILVANPLQGSSSTFSCVDFPSVFAFQAGMWSTLISASFEF